MDDKTKDPNAQVANQNKAAATSDPSTESAAGQPATAPVTGAENVAGDAATSVAEGNGPGDSTSPASSSTEASADLSTASTEPSPTSSTEGNGSSESQSANPSSTSGTSTTSSSNESDAPSSGSEASAAGPKTPGDCHAKAKSLIIRVLGELGKAGHWTLEEIDHLARAVIKDFKAL